MKNKSILVLGIIVGMFICLVQFDINADTFSEQKSSVLIRYKKPKPFPANDITPKKSIRHIVHFI